MAMPGFRRSLSTPVNQIVAVPLPIDSGQQGRAEGLSVLFRTDEDFGFRGWHQHAEMGRKSAAGMGVTPVSWAQYNVPGTGSVDRAFISPTPTKCG